MHLPSQNCAHRHLDWGWRFGISLHMIDDSGWIVMLWLLIVSFSYALVGQYSASLGHLYGANAGYSNLIIRYVTLIKLWFPSTGHWRDFKRASLFHTSSHKQEAGLAPEFHMPREDFPSAYIECQLAGPYAWTNFWDYHTFDLVAHRNTYCVCVYTHMIYTDIQSYITKYKNTFHFIFDE